ncbi:MAG: DNA mismatch repair protein MutS [Bacteroidetes bacterium MED-G17]|nr:MAG: DNA mismatch repair protein MutS [Bacteroidetes bacterium MED-G17]
MRQYREIKEKYPNTILLFRVGDFYETFGKDAIIASEVLGIVLTKRANGKASHVELAGFPHHSLDVYLPKLVKNGYRVAVCDQLEDPKKTKTIVKRGVTDMLTPGVATHDQVIDAKKNNYLCSLYQVDKQLGLGFVDFSTGEFQITQGQLDTIVTLLHAINPAEILVSKKQQNSINELLKEKYYLYAIEDWFFDTDFAKDKIFHHYKVNNLKGFGIEDLDLALLPAGAILHYFQETHQEHVGHLHALSRLNYDDVLWLDQFTVRNLELIDSAHPDGLSLLDILDKCSNPMGSRLLKKWLLRPLVDLNEIQKRQKIVSLFFSKQEFESQTSSLLRNIGDLERMAAKLALRKIGPRELKQMAQSINHVVELESICTKELSAASFPLRSEKTIKLVKEIETYLVEEPPALSTKGDLIQDGIDEKLDQFRDIRKNGKEHLINIQQKAIEETGIISLKIGFNNVFGYYLEVTNVHKDKVPSKWIRKQTLTNAERYITEELKQYEQKILNAEEHILDLEKKIYDAFIERIQSYVPIVQNLCFYLAQLDCLRSFGHLAFTNKYTCPKLKKSQSLSFKKLRHPVIETQLPSNESYIPNDLHLNKENQQIIVLTGPNMSGKSAILRQTALAVIMAQIGCFVPANEAEIGIVDKIFTRVGASDNISQGESTFMVEMLETSSILNNLSSDSLILLDEIGRGTSTYDGISLAWSIAEYLHQCAEKPKVLFATHYHELNQLEKKHTGIVNFHISSKEMQSQVVFLRKLTRGASNSSFGIHVAAMAGMPNSVLQRAQALLNELENERGKNQLLGLTSKSFDKAIQQIPLFENQNKEWKALAKQLSLIDTNTITPIEALLKLNELKSIIKN